MKRVIWFGSFLALAGCGAPEQADQQAAEATGSTEQFVVWSPGAALVNEHTKWHLGGCGTAGARRCPASGEEFFSFHRDFMNRLRNEYERQGLTANIDTWYFLPPEMRSSANGWTPALSSASAAIESMVDPTTGARFASVERFGTFVEGQLHNALHGIAKKAYGENAIGPIDMSPTSTYFFKIHGLVERYYQLFQRGDFNKDGLSDLVVRNTSTGANSIWFTNNSGGATRNNIASADTACGWYVGATADMNYDGNVDLIWHGPNCGQTSIWLMNGLTQGSSMQPPPVDSSWKLIGSADYTGDDRPDLVWWLKGTTRVDIWRMNKTTYLGSITLNVPTGWSVELPLDMLTLNPPGLVLSRSTGFGQIELQFLAMRLGGIPALPALAMNGLNGNSFIYVGGAGRFHAGLNYPADLAFNYVPPAPFNGFELGLLNTFGPPAVPNYTVSGVVALNPGEMIQGPR